MYRLVSMRRIETGATVKSACYSFPSSFLFSKHRIYLNTKHVPILVLMMSLFASLEYSIPRSVAVQKGWVWGLETCWSCASCCLFHGLVRRWTRTPSDQKYTMNLWPQKMWSKAAVHILGPLHKDHESWQILQWPRDMQCFERLEKEHHRIDDTRPRR
jgi:hypothetical protein